jgi:hypothetical protein
MLIDEEYICEGCNYTIGDIHLVYKINDIYFCKCCLYDYINKNIEIIVDKELNDMNLKINDFNYRYFRKNKIIYLRMMKNLGKDLFKMNKNKLISYIQLNSLNLDINFDMKYEEILNELIKQFRENKLSNSTDLIDDSYTLEELSELNMRFKIRLKLSELNKEMNIKILNKLLNKF